MKSIHKKSQSATVLIAVVIFLFVFGFLSILGYYMTSEYVVAFNSTGLYTVEMENAANGFLFTHKLMDYAIVLIMIGLIIGIGVTSYRIATTPVFFIVMFTTGIFYGFISYIFNYMFQQIVSQPIFATVLVHFPRTIMICKNLHWVMLAEIIVASITLYAKRERGQYLS